MIEQNTSQNCVRLKCILKRALLTFTNLISSSLHDLQQTEFFLDFIRLQIYSEPREGGGGALDFQVDGGGGVPLGFENLTLSQCARRTKNTPCHNIPYKKLAYDTLS